MTGSNFAVSGSYSDALYKRAVSTTLNNTAYDKDQLLKLPLWQYTGEQLLELLDSRNVRDNIAPKALLLLQTDGSSMGLKDFASFFNAAKATAHRIKNSA